MATTIRQAVGARVPLPSGSLATLLAGTYCTSDVCDCAAAQPTDVIVEVMIATAGTPAGNKQVKIFLQESLGDDVYRSGPGTGSLTAREANLRYLGSVPLTTAATQEVATMSVCQGLGYVPVAFRVVIYNDAGVALTDGALHTAEISTTVA